MKLNLDKLTVNKIFLAVFVVTAGIVFMMSCVKSGGQATPIPVWEDNNSDSATLKIVVQTTVGVLMVNQGVNLALSRDSLSNSNLVRKAFTNANGIVKFSKLYPRTIWYNCMAITPMVTYYGSGKITLLPGTQKDTILTVR